MSALDTLIDSDGQQRPLRALLQRPKELARALDALPIEVALEVLIAPDGPGVDLLVDRTKLDLGPRLTAAHGPWARAALDMLAERPRPDRWLARWAFVALARAGLRCEARWEHIFPTAIMRQPSTAITEAARTLPSDRVAAVAQAAMARDEVSAPQTACAILAAHDDEALARHLLAYRSAAWGQERLRKLLAPLADRPGIARAFAADVVAGGPSLRRIARLRVDSLAALEPIQREQLALAGHRHDGVNRPLGERLRADGGEGSFGGLCEYVVLEADGGDLRVDAWLYAGDSGTLFRAGTTEVIATLVQGGLQLADGQPTWLADALARVV